MRFDRILLVVIFFFITACNQYNITTKKELKKKIDRKYKNTGFTLVYNSDLSIKELDERSLLIYHSNLKKKSFVKITNPRNNKSLIAEVKSNKIKYSNFYNSVISNRIAENLDLDPNEPFIEIVLISKESTFIAKKAKTFDEEREVAEKAPISGIKISNLTNEKKVSETKSIKKKFSYSIKVADFYYKKTADLMLSRIKTETSIKKAKVIQQSKTNYRVLIGPFNDIQSLKESFEKMNSLYFENLEIIKNV